MKKQKQIFFALFIIIALAIIYYINLPTYITLEALKQQKDYLLVISQTYYWISAIAYIIIYCLVTTFSLPGAAPMSLLGGFLFGTFFGALYVIIGATIGAVLAFLGIRYLLGSMLQNRYKKRLKHFNQDLVHYGALYLLSLRLIPLFPFFLINILSGLTTISTFTFFWTTLLGIIPGALIFTFAGNRFYTIKTIADVFSYKMLFAFLLLALFVLIPVIYKKYILAKKEL